MLIKKIAALIFVAGDQGISLAEIATTLDRSQAVVRQQIQLLRERLVDIEFCPVELSEFNQRFRWITKEEVAEDIVNWARNPLNQRLSRAQVETLSIIAYRQPITRMDIDQIRGVSSQNMIQRLMQRDLIEIVGEVEGPGRPHLYGVTAYFMDYFALNSLEDLPPLRDLDLNLEVAENNLFSFKHWAPDQEESLFEEE